jgi:ribosome-associated protein
MIHVTPGIVIDENEIHQEFIQASGPGGQNVNKVATAVQLSFDVTNSPSLPEGVRERLLSLAGRRVTKEGVLSIHARRFRSQEANRQDAMERLVELIRKAVQKPPIRRNTKPTRASKMRRLEAKRHRAKTKSLRRTLPEASDG